MANGSYSLTASAEGKLSNSNMATKPEGMRSEDEIPSLGKLPSIRSNGIIAKSSNCRSSLFRNEEEEKARSMISRREATLQLSESDKENINVICNFGVSEECSLLQEQLFSRNETASSKA